MRSRRLCRLAALLALLPIAALGRVSASEELLYGGVYSAQCNEPSALRARLFGDTMRLEQGRKAVVALDFKSSKTAPSNPPPPAFRITYVGEVAGGDGLVFVHAGGTVIRKELNNETLRLDTGCLVAFSSGIDYDIGLAGGLKSMLFGGEGLLLATLRGSGSVWIQSLPFSRLAERIYEATFKAREEVRAGGQ